MTKNQLLRGAAPTSPASLARHFGGFVLVPFILSLAGMLVLSACGGSSSSAPQQNAMLSGNWQFTMDVQSDGNSSDPTFGPSLQGGFMLESNGSTAGQVAYLVAPMPQAGSPIIACNSGTAAITAKGTGSQTVLTVVAGDQSQPGTQTFTLTVAQANASTMSGTYTSTAPIPAAGGSVCGYGTTGNWSAVSVPPLTGSVTGTFHSGGVSFNNQDFAVTGSLTQGQNIGASSATVTGTLNFLDPTTGLSAYPCVPTGTLSVTGQISGSAVILQLFGLDGSNAGQIGIPPTQAGLNLFEPVTFQSAAPSNSYMLHSGGLGYTVNTAACRNTLADIGYVCLALNSTSTCQQPITLSPASLSFAPQTLVECGDPTCSQVIQGSPSSQTVTLTNRSGATLSGLALQFVTAASDFTGAQSFAEQDTCGTAPFSLTSGQSCKITVSYFPQQGCSWGPQVVPRAQCPDGRLATVTATVPPGATADNDNAFAVPVSSAGISYIQPSSAELDFGAQALGQASLPQLLSFTNQSAFPVKILGPRNPANPCNQYPVPLTLPLVDNGQVSGLQVVETSGGVPIAFPGIGQVQYDCDIDATSLLPNFQISSDTCTGATLQPQAGCNLQIAFAPQPATPAIPLDYFLQLNTLSCTSTQTTDCELDSARFAVELKSNQSSPIRMLPAAGLDFGAVPVNTSSPQKTITLFNDPADPLSATVNFTSKIQVSGSYSETDDCPVNLAPGSSCTLTVTFKPKAAGFNQGQLTIVYTLGSIASNGAVQFVYMRGVGQ